jgi:transcriptional regulator of acetoin/glycerol metabolism
MSVATAKTKGGRKAGKVERFSPDEVNKIDALFRQGWNIGQVCDALQMSRGTFMSRMLRAGFEPYFVGVRLRPVAAPEREDAE